MIPPPQSTHRERPLARALFSVFAALVALWTASCASSFDPAHRLVPVPAGALAAAPLAQHRIAVLAGSAQSKGVYIVDLASGEVLRSFGVTKEATGVSAETGNGPLLLSIGGTSPNGNPFGSVERWTLAGFKTQVVPMPAQALGITRIEQGEAYVLVGNGTTRSAVPLGVPSLAVHRGLALESGAKTLQLCTIGASGYLLYTGSQGTVAIREIRTGVVVRSTVVADSPACVDGRPQVFAVSRSFAAASVAMLALPTLLEQGLIPASNDAVALYQDGARHLIALNGSEHASNVEQFPDDALTPKAAKQ